MKNSNRSKEIVVNTLIKVLEYEKYLLDGRVALKIHRVSLISQDPGHRFGNPIDYYDVYDVNYVEKKDEPAITTYEDPIENQIRQQWIQSPNAVSTTASSSSPQQHPLALAQNLVELYSCYYPVNEKPIDSKIPRTGWNIDSHGISPGPKCRWIPASGSTEEEKR